jgi:DNA-binding PucR family transcriptional regulator
MLPRRGSRETVRRVERASGRLATQAIAAMEARLPWFASMPARQRSWVGLVAQAGFASFVSWLRDAELGATVGSDVSEIFQAAPRELTRTITLRQTVDLVRVMVDVVESQVDALAAPGEEMLLREAVLRFSREIAFAAAEVYARAAEARGSWDARLEALVVDALLRGESDDELRSRAAALGWTGAGPVCVVVGGRPAGESEAVLDSLQRAARLDSLDVLAAVQDDLLVVVLGGASVPVTAVSRLLPEFGGGPVVVGPTVADLSSAARSAEAALAGLRAAVAWPGAPRPVLATDLLPERAIDGDLEARRLLLEEIYLPLARAGGALLETVGVYVESAGSIEGAARALFVHPNTVRYRLRRVTDICGCLPGRPRDAFTLQVALVLGRLSADGTPL